MEIRLRFVEIRGDSARIMDARNDFCLHQSIRDALGVKRENVRREDVMREGVRRLPPLAGGLRGAKA